MGTTTHEPSGARPAPDGPLETAADDDAYLAQRYGARDPRRSRRALLTVIAALVVIAVGATVWVAVGQAGVAARTRDVGYEVVSEDLTVVRFDVMRDDPSVPVRCAAQALDSAFAQVGVAEVDVPAGSRAGVRVEVPVRTLQQASNALAVEGSCYRTD